MSMLGRKANKERVKVRIVTDSAIIEGTMHVIVDGRLSDYMTSQKGKFITITDTKIFHLNPEDNSVSENSVQKETLFVNCKKIEMIEYI